MRILEAISLTDLPSPGALLGSSGSASVITAIQDSFGASSYFGSHSDPFKDINNAFIKNIVEPIKSMSRDLSKITTRLLNPNEIRPLLTLDDFKFTPKIMELPILMYQPLREMLKQGRISGYGYDYDDLPEEDVYGRLISNGLINDVLTACGNKKYADLNYVWTSEDPELSLDDIEHIESTRFAVDFILETTTLDPTDISNQRS